MGYRGGSKTPRIGGGGGAETRTGVGTEGTRTVIGMSTRTGMGMITGMGTGKILEIKIKGNREAADTPSGNIGNRG